MSKIRTDAVLKKAKTFEKAGDFDQARRQYQLILEHFPKNARARQGLEALPKSGGQTHAKSSALLPVQLGQLEALIKQGRFAGAVQFGQKLVKQEPDAWLAWTLLGQAHLHLNQLDQAVQAFRMGTELNPQFAAGFNDLGAALQIQGALDEAIKAYEQSLSLDPTSSDALGNLGWALQSKGRVDEAVDAYHKALSVKPDDTKSIVNLAVVLSAQGLTGEAIDAYHRALSIDPDHARAHHGLSALIKYEPGDPQMARVEQLIKGTKLTGEDRCHLHFALAKMQEDAGDLKAAFDSYKAGGAVRQKTLAYSFAKDQALFAAIKRSAPKILKHAPLSNTSRAKVTPIFILGMPRSGTTLVEQILSSHSQITGAGELGFLGQFGAAITFGHKKVNGEALRQVREAYLDELAKLSGGRPFVTDKLPLNFLQIGLIASAMPEAKIIHMTRDPAATCWSNFKTHFSNPALAYSYDLQTLVAYYGLYKDLMAFWEQQCEGQIYRQDYDQLTHEQDTETRALIDHLGLEWEEACLTPHENKRAVSTASQFQVRQKVYKSSSLAWRKFEPFLDGAFDELLEKD